MNALFNLRPTPNGILIAAVSAIVLGVLPAPSPAQTVNIAPMTWTQRTDWINVMTDPNVSPHAKGDGITDDTAALQSAVTLASTSATQMTVYLPPGTYKITSTVSWNTGKYGIIGRSLVGCGSNTTIAWYGPSGGTMFHSMTDAKGSYTGIRWDGRSLANTAIWFDPLLNGYAEAPLRHFNEAFLNFTGVALNFLNAGNSQWTGEADIWNCLFYKCHYGAQIGLNYWNNYEYLFENCEFEYCDTAIDSCKNTAQMVFNTHFANSTITDMTSTVNVRARHCASTNSKAFLAMPQHTGGAGKHVLEDCWIDSWSNTGTGIASGAIQIGDKSLTMIFDCKFTTPPNANPPINMINTSLDTPNSILVSNNSCPGFSTQSSMVQTAAGGGPANVLTVNTAPANPNVGITTSLASANSIFLDSVPFTDSTHILDVTVAPYNAKKDYSADATAAIQQAINDAKAANNGSIVYLPVGYYKITSTLNVSGGNYTVEGGGFETQIIWAGSDGSTMFTLATPSNITLKNFLVKTMNTSVHTGTITETATAPASLVVDWVFHAQCTAANYTLLSYMPDGGGISLTSLPGGSFTYLGTLQDNLVINDCGSAEIFGNHTNIGRFTIEGATQPKTGFLGFLYGNTGMGWTAEANSGLYDINVKDNQDLVFGDYYNEQTFNNLHLEADSATWSGRVTLQAFKQQSYDNSTAINVNNFKGRLFYGPQVFENYSGVDGNSPGSLIASNITQTGSNAVDLILPLTTFDGAAPVISLGSGCNLIQQFNNWYSTAGAYTLMNNVPSTLTSADDASMAAGLDHLRQLGLEDLKRLQGIGTTTVFQENFQNATSATGGSMVLNPNNSSALAVTIKSTPPIGSGNFLNTTITSGAGALNLAKLTPAATINSWAALAQGTTNAGVNVEFNGAFDLFVRPNSVPSGDQTWFRPVDIDNRPNGGLRIIFNGAGSFLQFNLIAPSGVNAFSTDGTNYNLNSVVLTPTYALTPGTIHHVGFTMHMGGSGQVIVNMFAVPNTGAINTQATPLGSMTFYVNASLISVPNTLSNGAWTMSARAVTYPFSNNVDYSTMRLFNGDPGIFQAVQ